MQVEVKWADQLRGKEKRRREKVRPHHRFDLRPTVRRPKDSPPPAARRSPLAALLSRSAAHGVGSRAVSVVPQCSGSYGLMASACGDPWSLLLWPPRRDCD